ncbi:hypothetical protein, partial [Arachnia propionica]|uniref:hypothetical protein n=1 Tax=Arachnia propionica TaxID=1750 RepID=UPI001C8C57FE
MNAPEQHWATSPHAKPSNDSSLLPPLDTAEFAKMDDAYNSNLTLVAGHDIRKSLPRNNDSIDKGGET